MVAFLLAAWRHADAVGSHTPLISGAGSFFLVGIALLSLVAALVFGVAGINALMDAPRIGAQCPLEQGETGDSTVGNEADNVVQWENQTVRCGIAWENELSSALTGKGGKGMMGLWFACSAQSGDVAGVGASDFFGNTAQMLENGFTLIVSLSPPFS